MEVLDLIKNKDIIKLSKIFKSLINKWIHKYDWSRVGREDLQQEAIFAVMSAVKYFDVTKSSSFGLYLEYWLHYHLGQYVLRNVNLVRPCTNYLVFESAELSEVKKKAIDDYHNFSYIDIDNPDCQYQLPENLQDFDRAICGKQLKKLAKKELSERTYDILCGRCDDKSLSQLGKKYSLSKERIRQIELLAIQKLRKKLGISENGTEKFS
jgi:RNA polymerase sigma factor, sigma-70 family|nr:MAG TPA: DNA directed RNA polymerase subunit [Caudoviricetes sp.]